jgi:hypothetical protein
MHDAKTEGIPFKRRRIRVVGKTREGYLFPGKQSFFKRGNKYGRTSAGRVLEYKAFEVE